MKIRTTATVLALAIAAAGCQAAQASQAGPSPERRARMEQRIEQRVERNERRREMRRERRGPEDAPVLGRMLRQSLRTLADREGEEAARARMQALRESRQAALRGVERGDREAMRDAMRAASLDVAETIVAIEGDAVVEELLERGDERIEQARERLAELGDNGRNPERATELLERLEKAQTEARAELAAGNAAEALITAARIAEAGPRPPMRPRAPMRPEAPMERGRRARP